MAIGAGTPAAQRRVVAAFDVDGTLTRRDTLLPFLVRAFGRLRVARAFTALAPHALRFALGRITIDAFKCRVIERLFTGVAVEPMHALGVAHAKAMRARMRPAALERLRWHLAQGHAVVIVSAGLELYLRPFAADLGISQVLCTRLATVAGGAGARFSGALEGEDCSGAAKARRLVAAMGDLANVELHAYGDSAGDRELLALADHPHWRPFR